MNTIMLTQKQLNNLLPYHVEKEVRNSEAQIFILNQSNWQLKEDLLLKKLFITNNEAMASKLFTVSLLSDKEEEAREKLISHNLRLVVYLAKKFENTGVGVEDLISIGTIGLIKGINTFNQEKQIKLATYASRCIENEILMYLRRNSKIRYEVSFDEPLNVDWDGNELLLSDILGTEEDLIYRDLENELDKKLLHRALNTLGEREREIIEMRYGIGKKYHKELTQKEVADALGISQSYISRLEKKIMKTLRLEIQKQQ